MRRAIYITLLLAIAVTGLTAMSLGLDRLVYGGRGAFWLFWLGLYWSSLAVVSLAEDVAEVLLSRKPIGRSLVRLSDPRTPPIARSRKSPREPPLGASLVQAGGMCGDMGKIANRSKNSEISKVEGRQGAAPPFAALRKGEALGLQWDSLDLDRRVAVLADTKTGRSIRPLSQAACDLLQRQPRGPNELVFPGAHGGSGAEIFKRQFKRIAALGGLCLAPTLGRRDIVIMDNCRPSALVGQNELIA